MNPIVKAVVVAILIQGAGGANAVVSVGPGCDYASIQDAIDALSEAPPGDAIVKVVAAEYHENLLLDGRTLQLWGGYDGCDSLSPGSDASIVDGGGRGTVLTITGSSYVTLRRMTLSGGASERGGGISFDGSGILDIINSEVSHNSATDAGGGIHFTSTEYAQLRIRGHSLISNNDAAIGGGVNVAGDARMLLTGRGAGAPAVAFNTAQLVGGGLSVDGTARAELGSEGYAVTDGEPYGAISHNVATQGAGIYVGGSATVRAFRPSAGKPLRIEYNGADGAAGSLATSAGGGIAVDTSKGRFCGWGYSISHNFAATAAAISSSSGGIELMHDAAYNDCGSETATALGAAECLVGVPCNLIEGNHSHATTDASAIRIEATSHLNAERFVASDNGSPLVASGGAVHLMDCLVSGNRVGSSNSLIRTFEGAAVLIEGCTFSDNGTSGTHSSLFKLNGPIKLSRSIIWEPGAAVLTLPTPPVDVHDLVVSERASIDATQGAHEGISTLDPLFMDAPSHDFHLQSSSPAIDYTADFPSALDLESHIRGTDVHGAGLRFDLGAFEYFPDSVFADGFEARTRKK